MAAKEASRGLAANKISLLALHLADERGDRAISRAKLAKVEKEKNVIFLARHSARNRIPQAGLR